MNILSTYSWAVGLVSLFGAVFFIQLLYHLYFFFRLSFKEIKDNVHVTHTPVSVVLVARNVEDYLSQNLPLLLQQNYEKYEVIVVNDHSSDDTADVLMILKNKYPHLKIVSLDSVVTNIRGGRFPLSLGIRSATYDHILVTEPSCYPVTAEWLQTMASHFEDKKSVVLGFSTYEKKENFLNALHRYDIAHHGMQYFSYAKAKLPFTGSGKNMAYSKSLFFKSKGFISHNNLSYGANELFATKVAKANNTAVEFSQAAHVIARPTGEHKMWRRSKLARNKMQRCYKPSQKLLLGFYHVSIPMLYVAFGLALAAALSHQVLLIVLLSIMLLKQVLQYVSFGKVLVRLNEKQLVPFILFFDIILALINPWFYVRSLFGKTSIV